MLQNRMQTSSITDQINPRPSASSPNMLILLKECDREIPESSAVPCAVTSRLELVHGWHILQCQALRFIANLLSFMTHTASDNDEGQRHHIIQVWLNMICQCTIPRQYRRVYPVHQTDTRQGLQGNLESQVRPSHDGCQQSLWACGNPTPSLGHASTLRCPSTLREPGQGQGQVAVRTTRQMASQQRKRQRHPCQCSVMVTDLARFRG